MNSSIQKPVAGFVLSLVTAMMWGILPIVLKELLAGLDATTIVWYRFLVAFVVLAGWLAIKGQLPPIRSNGGPVNAMLLVAALALCANYFLFSFSLNFVMPKPAKRLFSSPAFF
jgi:drug/metabolite transporter (DMT)-like permease